MPAQSKKPRDEDNGWVRGGELDYDTLLAHYQDQGEPEPMPEPLQPREKKTFISSLLSDVKSEGKFAKKKGGKPARPQEEPAQEEELQLSLDELKPAPKPPEAKEKWEAILSQPPADLPQGEPEAPESRELDEVLESVPQDQPDRPRHGTPMAAELPREAEAAGEPAAPAEAPGQPGEPPKKRGLWARLAGAVKSTQAPDGEAGEDQGSEELAQVLESLEPPEPREAPEQQKPEPEPEAPPESEIPREPVPAEPPRKKKKKKPGDAPPEGQEPPGGAPVPEEAPEPEPVREAAPQESPETPPREEPRGGPAPQSPKKTGEKKLGKRKKTAPRREEPPERPGREPSLVEWAYIETYYIGIQLMRDLHLLRRQVEKNVSWIARNVPLWLGEQRRRFLKLCDRVSDTTLFPYREIAKRTGYLYHCLTGVGRRKGGFKIKLQFWAEYFKSLSRPLNHIANFAAPIVGVTILAATVTYFQGLNYALSVEYSGQNLGFIAKESVFYDAQQSVMDRMINEEYMAPEDSQPTFRIVVADKKDLVDQETLANRIIAISHNEVQEADGVYIEGAFLGALQDGNEFLMYIDSILESYRTGIEHELVQFVKGISVKRGIYPKSSVVPLYRITDDMESAQTRTVEHKVEEGENLSEIAEEYNTSVEQIMLLNPMLEERDMVGEDGEEDVDSITLIRGEVLTVAKVNLNLGVQVTRREVYTEDIPYGTTSVEDSRYYKGYQVTISAGVSGKQEVTADVTYIDGEKVAENRIGTPVVLREPVNQRVVVGTMPILTYLPSGGNSSESFMWPVKGGNMSAGLYGYAGHTGMDIAAPAGTEIRAAKDGQVTYATNYSIWPYGKRVDINHGNGVTTRYAHCSAVFVTAGQYVRQGDLIALVGRTGNASGNHCHFEIKINGAIMNPANFIGTRWPGY